MTDRAPENSGAVEVVPTPPAPSRPWDSPPSPGLSSYSGSPLGTAPGGTPTPTPTEAAPVPAPAPAPRRSTAAGRRSAVAKAKAKGPLANSLVSLIADIDLEITKVNDLSRSIDQHVSALNKQRAEQQERVRTLREMHAAVPSGTLGTYVDERLKELRTPAVVEEAFPWPRKV